MTVEFKQALLRLFALLAETIPASQQNAYVEDLRILEAYIQPEKVRAKTQRYRIDVRGQGEIEVEGITAVMDFTQKPENTLRVYLSKGRGTFTFKDAKDRVITVTRLDKLRGQELPPLKKVASIQDLPDAQVEFLSPEYRRRQLEKYLKKSTDNKPASLVDAESAAMAWHAAKKARKMVIKKKK